MDERVRWARLVASLLRTGVPLPDALAAGRDATDSFELAGPLGVIAEQVRRGSALALALAEHPEVFSGSEVERIRAGEAADDIASALESLSIRSP